MLRTRLSYFNSVGKDLSECTTLEEGLKKAGLDWSVRQHKVVVNGLEVPGIRGNVRSDNNTCVGIVSNQYKVVQNVDAFNFVDDILKGFDVKLVSGGFMSNGERVFLLAELPDKDIMGEKYKHNILISSGHNSRHSIKVADTPNRFICWNAVAYTLKYADRVWSINHSGNMEKKLEQASDTIKRANNYIDKLEEDSNILAEKSIDDMLFDALLDELLPRPEGENATNKKLENCNALRDELTGIYKYADDLKRFRNTAYGALQAVSDFVTHPTPKRVTNTFNERLVASIADGNKTLNDAHKFLLAV